VEDPTNDACLSLASVWEMAIKVSLGKLRLGAAVTDFLTEVLDRSAIGVKRIW